MANSRMTFCKVCGFKECHHISRLFVSASSEPLDKLAIIADKVSEVVGASSTICAATTVPPPSQSSSCSVQPTMDSLAKQIQELSPARVSIEGGICYYHRRYKEQARKRVLTLCICAKKRVSSVIAGMAEPSQHTSRLFLLDRKSGQKFLRDSGTYDMVRKELNLGLRRPLSGLLIIVDVSSPHNWC
ncbi:hypothetical protein TNCV_2702431 [Trichonephila clavipes]|nr:hypothetical protein TNCV_2702431 [Trichonephila clavipes]